MKQPPAEEEVGEFRRSVARYIRYTFAKDERDLSGADWFRGVALAIRDQLIDRMLATEARYERADPKRIYYLSLEFLMGRALGNALHNLRLDDVCRAALDEMGIDLEAVRGSECDPGLGNGGLGRLAACFLDSIATLDMPGYGYGINYEYGLFRQEIRNGYQQEQPDNWLAEPSPWLIERPDDTCHVPVYGRVVPTIGSNGRFEPHWVDWQLLVGVPHDMPVVGYGGHTVNCLRLFSARASAEFDIAIFNDGDYFRAVERKITSETISKVLYPSDAVAAGRELRLLQEYFFVACALRDIIRRYLHTHEDLDGLPAKVAIQMNDTHPTLAVVELMRLLLDEHHLTWDRAWEITVATFGYTNHTLLPEALERWPVPLLERILPRHLELIREIDRRFRELIEVRWPGDSARAGRMAIVEEGAPQQVRMAHLAVIGSHAVNGVAALHTELLKERLFADFHALWPERFSNKTNGVTPRRWLLSANPELAALITRAVGSDKWVVELSRLRRLERRADDERFRRALRKVKQRNKEHLAAVIKATAQVVVDPRSLFDVHAKRIHEYKRQLLAVMGMIHAYLRMVEDGVPPPVPRTLIFAGKAAPGYRAAKLTIKLIHNVASVINADRRVGDLLKVAFVPDYRVTLAERIVPAADLSEQISTAGTEASGTGNMKFAMNGAVIIGTLDGANIEIRDEVGAENIFIFGLRADEVAALREAGYRPRDYYERDADLRRVVDALASDRFCPGEAGLFSGIAEELIERDPYFHLADFRSYVDTQQRAAETFRDPGLWARMAILTISRMGKFSADRTVREYAEEIWGVEPMPPPDAARVRTRTARG